MSVLASLHASARHDDTVSVLRALIADGGYRIGDRLPAERELMASLGLTRTVLRKALDALEREGVIWRHVGKGTFVSGDGSPSDPTALLAKQVTPVKMLRARLTVEPAIAREAAINASAEALGRILRARDAAVAAGSWDEYELEDDRFHHEVAQATDNVVLVSLFDALNRTKRAVAWRNVIRRSHRPPEGYVSFKEHDAIAAAIEARDPVAAQEAMRRHIGSVSSRLFGEG